jgi:hypothetical protein
MQLSHPLILRRTLMDLTELDARTKHCPLSLISPDGPSRCRASACMAWRWRTEAYLYKTIPRLYSDGHYFPDEARIKPYLEAGWEIYDPRELRNSVDPERTKASYPTELRYPIPPLQREGYCGLAEPRLSEVQVYS